MIQFEGDLGPTDILQFIEEKLGAGIWYYDAASGRMQWSRGFYELLGLDPSKVVPSFAEINQRIHPDDSCPQRDFSEQLCDRSLIEKELRVIKPNGALRWIFIHAEVLLNTTGEPACALGVALDITRQRETLQSLKVAAERYGALTQAVEGLLWIASSDGRITGVPNPKAARLAAAPLVYGMGWIDLVHEDDRDAAQEIWSASVETGRPYRVECRVRQPDGTYRWCRSIAVPIVASDGSIREWMGTCIDVHHEKFSSLPAPSSKLTGAQIRASRGILNWSVKQLAERTGLSPAVIRRFEEYQDAPPMSDVSMEIFQKTFSEAGIEFLFPQVGKPGVRPR